MVVSIDQITKITKIDQKLTSYRLTLVFETAKHLEVYEAELPEFW